MSTVRRRTSIFRWALCGTQRDKRFGWADHAADGVHIEFVDDAADGRVFSADQPVLRRGVPLLKFGEGGVVDIAPAPLGFRSRRISSTPSICS